MYIKLAFHMGSFNAFSVNFTWLSWEKNKNICRHTALKICNIATTFRATWEQTLAYRFSKFACGGGSAKKKQCIYYLNVSKMYFEKHHSNADNELEFIETCQPNKNIYLLLNSARSWKQSSFYRQGHLAVLITGTWCAQILYEPFRQLERQDSKTESSFQNL